MIVVRADSPADAMADAPVEPAGPIEKFEILTVQLGDTEADSANVRVGDDGTVELPKVGCVKAEGLTAAGLREEIAAKLRERRRRARGSESKAPRHLGPRRRAGAGRQSPAAARRRATGDRIDRNAGAGKERTRERSRAGACRRAAPRVINSPSGRSSPTRARPASACGPSTFRMSP